MIIYACNQLSNILNDVLDYFTLKYRKIQLNYQPVYLYNISNNVIHLLNKSNEKTNINFINNIIENIVLTQQEYFI